MHNNLFNKIICLNNLFLSWKEFKKGKRHKLDVQEFERNLEDNLFKLHEELKSGKFQHSDYTSFHITDPKQRHIHKACVKDRIVHHAVYRILYPIFDQGFIFDSYSCRNNKGTHRAVNRLERFIIKVSQNYVKPCFVLKCDIKRYFDSIDHEILFNLIKKKISDKRTLDLIWEIIGSYHLKTNCHSGISKKYPESIQIDKNYHIDSRFRGNDIMMNNPFSFFEKGLPIGNLTSQLFANIYLNELDKFIKHKLRIKYYLRYCDDFVIISNCSDILQNIRIQIQDFLLNKLKLRLHPNKISIKKLKQGIDFLGYAILPHYRILRTKTKRRMLKRVNLKNLQSYLGLLSHCNGYKLIKIIKNLFFRL